MNLQQLHHSGQQNSRNNNNQVGNPCQFVNLQLIDHYQQRPNANDAVVTSNFGNSYFQLPTSVNRQQYVQNTLSEIMQRPKKGSSSSSSSKVQKGPFKRQQLAVTASPSTMSGSRGSNNNCTLAANNVASTSVSGSGSKKRPNFREENYNVFIPKKSLTCQQFNAKVECKGCNKSFSGTIISAGIIFGEPNYFVHCIKECVQYRALGLTRKCDECALLFMNSQSERKHHGECHKVKKRKKPFWMSDRVYKVRAGIRCNTKVSCTACGQFFGAQSSSGKISYSLDYLIHCIEECAEYRKLDLIQTCPTCNCRFLNRLSLSQHKLKSKH